VFSCKLIDFGSEVPSDGDSVYIDFPSEIAGCEVSEKLLQAVVSWQLAHRRSGTAHAKTIGEIAATTKKPWRQKGTGRARHGNLVAAQFRGGAVIFGPQPRDFGGSLNKKARRRALAFALGEKLRGGALAVSRGNMVEDEKTKHFVAKSRAFLGDYKSLLYCVQDLDRNLHLSSRNVPNVTVLPVAGLNVYDILRSEMIVLDENAIAGIVARVK
jgi:large subunit ribosomal protein L4